MKKNFAESWLFLALGVATLLTKDGSISGESDSGPWFWRAQSRYLQVILYICYNLHGGRL